MSWTSRDTTTKMTPWVLLVVVAVLANDVQSTGKAPSVKLSNGEEMPVLGLGTWFGPSRLQVKNITDESKANELQNAVECALDNGYTHIDTAFIYKTEVPVGRGIRKKIDEGVIKREDLFVTTKLWNDKHAKEDVLPALRLSLKNLGLDYVNLYLIHWPVAFSANGSLSDTDYLDTWQGMVEAQQLGLTKSIGVSNFNQQQLERLIANSSVVPQVLQVEINLNLQQPALLEYCRSKNISVTGYTPFGSLFYFKATDESPPPRVDTPELVAMAQKYNKTVTQVNLRYLMELGVVVIPKSVTKSRVEENIDIFDFHLSEDDKELLKGYDANYRTVAAEYWSDSQYYPF